MEKPITESRIRLTDAEARAALEQHLAIYRKLGDQAEELLKQECACDSCLSRRLVAADAIMRSWTFGTAILTSQLAALAGHSEKAKTYIDGLLVDVAQLAESMRTLREKLDAFQLQRPQ